jgi:putative mRNA 3-end processing factor
MEYIARLRMSILILFITHGHSDHARKGHKSYLCTNEALPVIKHRLGNIAISSIDFGEDITVNGVKFSFHRAAHILGSAQIRVEHKGEIAVVSGDYKTQKDPIAGEFESVKCHSFITESTFGLPVYKWKEDDEVFNEINTWWKKNKEEGKVSVLNGYSLGKAQRLLMGLDESIGDIYVDKAVGGINSVIEKQGVSLKETKKLNKKTTKKEYEGCLVITSSSSADWGKIFGDFSTAFASGWMMLRGTRRWRSLDRGFVLSDHADWEGLNAAIEATGAHEIFVTHGYTDVFSRWLKEQGYDAKVLKTEYGEEEENL